MLFSMFSTQFWAFRTIKIKTVLAIFYGYFIHSLPQNLNHWLSEKSEIINLQNADSTQKYNQRAQQCLPQLFWCRCHFGTFKSLGSSSPVKMSQAFHDSSICLNFLYFHQKVNTFKTREMCLYLDSDIWAGCLLFLWDLFNILSRFLAGSCSVKMLQAFHDPIINFDHHVWERQTCLKLLKCTFILTQTFEADVSQLFLLELFSYFKFLTKINS